MLRMILLLLNIYIIGIYHKTLRSTKKYIEIRLEVPCKEFIFMKKPAPEVAKRKKISWKRLDV